MTNFSRWFDVYHNDPSIPEKLQMRRATSCFLLDVFLLDTSQDKTLVLEDVLS